MKARHINYVLLYHPRDLINCAGFLPEDASTLGNTTKPDLARARHMKILVRETSQLAEKLYNTYNVEEWSVQS
jgi:hypothetical protein